ncbi:hypothetical protein [Kiritimatiella glycovorans]|uniref:Uncharacterized protein n=1 Tax=Kiritimatiella glycovorans TaxID=1307763 RepID=A0A0G3EHM8_9BACT|nr:hypothetical protein [Kiritimatiella glycovorans]AKJ64300.1 hypothetical protein L21SP4_01043 [Kiritimatiella glycovorans]
MNKFRFGVPEAGHAVSIASGVAFLFLLMMLPLVGPAGAKTPHAATNAAAFGAVLLLVFLLAAAAVFLKRRDPDTPKRWPAFPTLIGGLCLFLALAWAFGLLRI